MPRGLMLSLMAVLLLVMIVTAGINYKAVNHVKVFSGGKVIEDFYTELPTFVSEDGYLVICSPTHSRIIRDHYSLETEIIKR